MENTVWDTLIRSTNKMNVYTNILFWYTFNNKYWNTYWNIILCVKYHFFFLFSNFECWNRCRKILGEKNELLHGWVRYRTPVLIFIQTLFSEARYDIELMCTIFKRIIINIEKRYWEKFNLLYLENIFDIYLNNLPIFFFFFVE